MKSSTEKARATRRWSNEEIALLKNCVERFGTDLAVIAEKMKSRTAKQIKAQLDKNGGMADAAPELPPRADAHVAAAQAQALQAHAQQQAVQVQYQAEAESAKRKADFNDDLSGANSRARLDGGAVQVGSINQGAGVTVESAVGLVQHGVV